MRPDYLLTHGLPSGFGHIAPVPGPLGQRAIVVAIGAYDTEMQTRYLLIASVITALIIVAAGAVWLLLAAT